MRLRKPPATAVPFSVFWAVFSSPVSERKHLWPGGRLLACFLTQRFQLKSGRRTAEGPSPRTRAPSLPFYLTCGPEGVRSSMPVPLHSRLNLGQPYPSFVIYSLLRSYFSQLDLLPRTPFPPLIDRGEPAAVSRTRNPTHAGTLARLAPAHTPEKSFHPQRPISAPHAAAPANPSKRTLPRPT